MAASSPCTYHLLAKQWRMKQIGHIIKCSDKTGKCMVNGMMCLFNSCCILRVVLKEYSNSRYNLYGSPQYTYITQNLDSWSSWWSYLTCITDIIVKILYQCLRNYTGGRAVTFWILQLKPTLCIQLREWRVIFPFPCIYRTDGCWVCLEAKWFECTCKSQHDIMTNEMNL